MEGPKSGRSSLYFVLQRALGVCISSNIPCAVRTVLANEGKSRDGDLTHSKQSG